jgi:hypothetical protein
MSKMKRRIWWRAERGGARGTVVAAVGVVDRRHGR